MPNKIKVGITPFEFEIELPEINFGKDAEVVDALITELDGYRVLYAGMHLEYPAEVIEAVQRLRLLLNEYAKRVKPSSDVYRPVLRLRGACAEFLSIAKNESERLVRYHNADKASIGAGQHVYADAKAQVEHYDALGGPDLFTNKRLHITHIKPEGARLTFMRALGEMRGRFGDNLSQLCEVTGASLTDNLGPLTPDLEKLGG